MPALPTPERIPEDRRTRRRLEWQDTRRPAWVMWLSVACVILMGVALVALSNSERMSRPTAVNGDSLGPESGESLPAYAVRASETLTDGEAGPADSVRWALVTPEEPLDVAGLTTLFRPFAGVADLRVSTLLVGGVQWPVPEPAVGHRREDVFIAVRDRAAASAGVGVEDPSLRVTGVLVHARVPVLQDLAAARGVLAVEALPADAVFGRFGVRPAHTDGHTDGDTGRTGGTVGTDGAERAGGTGGAA
ncbi:MAG: hypothetical protein LKG15_07430 [Corynebacterium provencense]|uniref:hypothetical protein n=1 Tax=Corynebacterium provencense TaxID=1737425 RepID=UPI00298A0692|nr:hypothetical protein [Corynebacterium provencense]